MSLADEILSRWAPVLTSVDLKTGQKGRFEVSLDGELVFSKAGEARFPAPGEVARLLEQRIGPALTWRKESS